ncbi:MAG: hypothetical protein OEW42_00505 [Acidimicrobiia bacterium]|nr:hypothetical protein [Acidimicrobiia bacterium]MDH5237149.1 hypothetical protein [Acidimicrobiia bacterium]
MLESTTPNRRHFRLVPVVLVLALLSTACNYLDWGPGGPERPWWCDPTDTEVNDGHGGGAHGGHHFPYTEPKGPLTAGNCLVTDYMIEQALPLAEQFPTAGDAEDNGWFQLAPWIPGQGTHHLDLSYGIPSQFDWTRPTMLMYDSNSRSGQLTGMVWAVASGMHPPAGFPGDNDHWHAHQALCFRNGTIIGDGLTDAECAALGGNNVDSSGIWLLHVWLPVYDGWLATDIFNKEHPSIN